MLYIILAVMKIGTMVDLDATLKDIKDFIACPFCGATGIRSDQGMGNVSAVSHTTITSYACPYNTRHHWAIEKSWTDNKPAEEQM